MSTGAHIARTLLRYGQLDLITERSIESDHHPVDGLEDYLDTPCRARPHRAQVLRDTAVRHLGIGLITELALDLANEQHSASKRDAAFRQVIRRWPSSPAWV